MLSVNFRMFSLFLRISEIFAYILLILNSNAKFVPFLPFSKHEIIIVCLSFIERTDYFRCIDIAVI